MSRVIDSTAARYSACMVVRRGLLALAVLLLGCEGRGGLVVQVRTDLTPVLQFDRIETRVVSVEPQLEEATSVEGREWGRGVRVARFDDLPAGEYRFFVSAMLGDETVVERPVRATIPAGDPYFVTVLLTRDCAGVECPQDDPTALACLGGQCVEETCVEDPTAEGCAPPECTTAADCDSPASACATASCTPSGTCFDEPNHDLCAADEVCSVDDGCVSTGGMVDGGPPDAGPPDAGPMDAEMCASPCGVVPQCGCTGGQGCFVNSMAMRMCADPGTVADGDPCTASRDCAIGRRCYRPTAREMVRRCLPMCASDADCTGAHEVCYEPRLASIGVCAGVDCDPIRQTGCTGLDDCYYTEVVGEGGRVMQYRYCGVAGAQGIGEQCTDLGDCIPGTHCLPFGMMGRQCLPYCEAASDCTGFGAGSQCVLIGSTAPTPPIGVCTYDCDPLNGTSCPGGASCQIGARPSLESGSNVAYTYCYPPGTGASGSPCSSLDDCGAGLMCRAGFCRSICALSGPACTIGTCTALVPPALIGTTEYGYCQP